MRLIIKLMHLIIISSTYHDGKKINMMKIYSRIICDKEIGIKVISKHFLNVFLYLVA